MISNSSSSGHLDSMRVDGESMDPPAYSSNPSKQSISPEKRRVTIEDSMEVISELISEFQSSEALPSPNTINPQDHLKPSIRQTGQLQISFARKSKSGKFLPYLPPSPMKILPRTINYWYNYDSSSS
jgi:hypothetical protein